MGAACVIWWNHSFSRAYNRLCAAIILIVGQKRRYENFVHQDLTRAFHCLSQYTGNRFGVAANPLKDDLRPALFRLFDCKLQGYHDRQTFFGSNDLDKLNLLIAGIERHLALIEMIPDDDTKAALMAVFRSHTVLRKVDKYGPLLNVKFGVSTVTFDSIQCCKSSNF